MSKLRVVRAQARSALRCVFYTLQCEYVLDGRAVLVVRVAARLAAPLLVALHGAEVGDLHDDRLERAGERRRVRVLVCGYGEAASASVARSQSWTRAERKLADRGGVPVRGDSARCTVYAI